MPGVRFLFILFCLFSASNLFVRSENDSSTGSLMKKMRDILEILHSQLEGTDLLLANAIDNIHDLLMGTNRNISP